MKKEDENSDAVWKAIADSTRRQLMDVLAEGPCSTGELVERFDHLCRTNVMKHLDVLVAAGLVIVRRQGRQRWNFLNPVPIQRVCDRWVSQHVRRMACSISRLKDHVEKSESAGQAQKKLTATSPRKKVKP